MWRYYFVLQLFAPWKIVLIAAAYDNLHKLPVFLVYLQTEINHLADYRDLSA